MTGIYKIANTVNNKIYVGSSLCIEGRWYQHKSKLIKSCHSNKHLQSSWNKYGKDIFLFEIVENCEKEKLLEREQYWIDTLKAYDKDKGYNLRPLAESNLGFKQTEEAKKKISKSLKGNSWNTGKTLSEETKKKMSMSRKGRVSPMKGKKQTEDSKRKMSELMKSNTYGKGYKHTEEEKKKIGEASKGNKHNVGKVRTKETKRKISNTMKKKERILNE